VTGPEHRRTLSFQRVAADPDPVGTRPGEPGGRIADMAARRRTAAGRRRRVGEGDDRTGEEQVGRPVRHPVPIR